MPSMRKRVTKAGATFYEIRVSRGRSKSYLTRRWYPPEGWSKKAIDRELARVAAEFEREAHIIIFVSCNKFSILFVLYNLLIYLDFLRLTYKPN